MEKIRTTTKTHPHSMTNKEQQLRNKSKKMLGKTKPHTS